MKLFPSFRPLLISEKCDICIEGFPRSANSYTVIAFLTNNPKLEIAHHIHVPMQIIKAVKLNIPCLVLIRKPEDSLSSLLLVDKRLSCTKAIKSYINFYRRLERYKDKFVIADFSSITGDFANVVSNINQFYSTSFSAKPINSEQEKLIFKQLKSIHRMHDQPKYLIAIPTNEKQVLKNNIKKNILEHPLYPEAQNIYRKFTKNIPRGINIWQNYFEDLN